MNENISEKILISSMIQHVRNDFFKEPNITSGVFALGRLNIIRAFSNNNGFSVAEINELEKEIAFVFENNRVNND